MNAPSLASTCQGPGKVAWGHAGFPLLLLSPSCPLSRWILVARLPPPFDDSCRACREPNRCAIERPAISLFLGSVLLSANALAPEAARPLHASVRSSAQFLTDLGQRAPRKGQRSVAPRSTHMLL